MSKTKVAINGSENIGTDLITKIRRQSDTIEVGALVGIGPASDGRGRAQNLDLPTTDQGLFGFTAMPGFAFQLVGVDVALDLSAQD